MRTPRRIFILVLLAALLVHSSVWAATFTSKATGNWSASGQTTWNEVGVPGAADTVTISAAHTITVDLNTTTAGIATAGPLIVATGATLTTRGNVSLTNTTLTMNAGSGFTFDDNSTGTVLLLQIGTAGASTAKLICNGSAGSRVTIQSKVGGTNGRITSGTFSGGGQADCAYANFTRVGDASHNSLEVRTMDGGASVFRLTHVILDASGPFTDVTGNIAYDSLFVLDGVTTKNSAGTLAYDLAFEQWDTSQARSITNCVFDLTGHLYRYDGTLTNTLFADVPVQASQSIGTWTFTNNLIVNFAGYGITSGSISNSYFIVNQAGNPHGPTLQRTGTQAFTGNVLETTAATTDGDMLFLAPSDVSTFTVTHNLVLPNANASGGSGNLPSLGGNANVTAIVEHNTLAVSVGEQGIGINETYHGHAGMLQSARSNLVWSVDGNGYIIIDKPGTNTMVDNYVTVADYNGRVAGMQGSYSPHAAAFASTPGAHDVIAAPLFVDSTRNIKTWDTSLGGPGTVAHALAELAKRNDAAGYNSAYSISALIAWVKAGFAPQAGAFQAAHDNISPSNGWIGALAGATTASSTIGRKRLR